MAFLVVNMNAKYVKVSDMTNIAKGFPRRPAEFCREASTMEARDRKPIQTDSQTNSRLLQCAIWVRLCCIEAKIHADITDSFDQAVEVGPSSWKELTQRKNILLSCSVSIILNSEQIKFYRLSAQSLDTISFLRVQTVTSLAFSGVAVPWRNSPVSIGVATGIVSHLRFPAAGIDSRHKNC
ncbi:hypothetical protein Nepgr_033402 [Nepenthes gracilis]|uniref:Uncharacterized protein n=1 Tax=Nepenthes gracilis TaxID=150966 RepID=A0AAD3Y6W5_NEPGR|nr:hypothetical protein Nepgr_033402 [Nepenthes gracilis]